MDKSDKQTDAHSTLTTTGVIIGRDRENHVFVDDRSVSKKHLIIRRVVDEYWVRLHDEATGTLLVNGKTCRYAKIQEGDQLTIGKTLLTVKTFPDFFLDIDRTDSALNKPAPLPTTQKISTGILVGKSPDCGVILDDPLVHDKHLFFKKEDKQYHVRLHSNAHSPFLLNSREAKAAAVKEGDIIRIGRTDLTVRTRPEFYLDVETFTQTHPFLKWGLVAGILAVVGITSLLFWPKIFPEMASAKYLERGKIHWQEERYKKAKIALTNAVRVNPRKVEAHYHLGLVLEKQGDYQEAFQSLATTVSLKPTHLRGLTRLARYLFLGNQLEQAKEMANRLLAIQPANAEGQILRVAILARTGKEETAIDEAEKILTDDPHRVEAVVLLASLYEKRNNYTNAINVYHHGLAALPDDPVLTARLAGLFERMDNQKEAERLLRKSVQAEPKEPPRWQVLTNYFMRTKQPEKSVETLKKAILANPDFHAFRIALASLHLQTSTKSRQDKKPDEAIGLLREVITAAGTEPVGMEARLKLAGILALQNQIDEADRLLQKVTAWDGKGPTATQIKERAWLIQGEIAAKQGESETAMTALQAVSKGRIERVASLKIQARVKAMKGEPESALEKLREAMHVDPRDMESRIMLASLLARMGKSDEAMGGLHAVLKNDPNNLQALTTMGRLQGSTGQWDASHSTAMRVQEAHPDSPVGYHLAGVTLQNLGKHENSVLEFDKALEKAPKNIGVLTALVKQHLRLKQPDTAIVKIRGVIKQDPENPIFHNLLGEVLNRQGEFEEAVSAFEQAIRLKPDWAAPYTNLGSILLAKNETERAIEVLKRGTREVRDNPVPAFMLASVYQKSGDFENAIIAYDKVLDVDPDSEKAANNLAMLLLEHKRDLFSRTRALNIAKRFEKSDNPSYLDTLGLAYYHHEEYQNGIKVLEVAVEKNPDIAEHQYHLGMVYHKSGNRYLAKTHLQKALEINADFTGAWNARSLLKEMW